MRPLLLLATALISLQPALAHAPPIGSHGAPQVNAGPYHVELVVADKAVDIYLMNHAGKVPQGSDSFTAQAEVETAQGMVVVDLKPKAPGHLAGTSAVALPATPKAVVKIQRPNGNLVEAKFKGGMPQMPAQTPAKNAPAQQHQNH